ncbi:MAG TPA: PH domain-containing protein [Candidatus Sulfopaludibacter sp.]|nr:PH domain-containing protein [Candidatus Sulfopaludibacter sp.]
MSYDSTAKVITIATFAILGVVAAASQSMVALGIAAVILVLSYAWSPRGYRIEGRSILVERLLGTARLALEDVREVRQAAGDDLDGCIRLFGNGGVFGYYGLFRTAKLGKTTWYVTDRSKIVVVVTGAKTALFSPDDVEGFLAGVRGSAPVTGNVERPVLSDGLRRTACSANTTVMLVGGALGMVALLVVAVALLYAPGPPSYTLTNDSLTIHDRFYPLTVYASGVDVSGIRIVDLEVNTSWRPVERTNGFANSHYQSGSFRLANGDIVRLYRAGGRQLVLLPAKGGGPTVMIQAENLIPSLRQAWGKGSP